MDSNSIGLAHTIGVSVAEIRYFKSAGPSVGTAGYVQIEPILLDIADAKTDLWHL